MNRELLEKPFTPEQIRQRKGRNGLLDYVEGHSVIQRLNEALEGAWSFEIVHHEIREEEVLVIGRLSADGITKMAFGGSQVTRERESGALISISDDLKAACTDSMKKCATFLGVGLHLYAEKPIGGRAPVARGPAAPSRPTSAPSPPARTPQNGTRPSGQPANGRPSNGHANGSITPRQLDAIWKVGRAKGLDPDAVGHMSLRVFNRKPDALTRDEASTLIKELSNLKRRVA
jgi:Rad52/22 family double-strand break repair protein